MDTQHKSSSYVRVMEGNPINVSLLLATISEFSNCTVRLAFLFQILEQILLRFLSDFKKLF